MENSIVKRLSMLPIERIPLEFNEITKNESPANKIKLRNLILKASAFAGKFDVLQALWPTDTAERFANTNILSFYEVAEINSYELTAFLLHGGIAAYAKKELQEAAYALKADSCIAALEAFLSEGPR